MPRRHLSPFARRARQFLGRPVYYRHDRVGAADKADDGRDGTPGRGDVGSGGRPPRSVLAIAYTGVRRPCICVGCIFLTPAERERQRRVFALVRAVTAAHQTARH